MPVQMCSRVLNLLTRLGGRITFVALIAVAFIEGSHEYGGKNSLIRIFWVFFTRELVDLSEEKEAYTFPLRGKYSIKILTIYKYL
jgi:hypothetical protein